MRNALTTHSFLRRVAAFLLFNSLHGSAISAQAPVAPGGVIPAARTHTDSGLVILKGVVTDSLNGGYLSGAIVAVSGTPLMATTDSQGRFRIDGIQPGTRRIDVFHSRLDEVGLAVVTPMIALNAGDSVSLSLAFPSGATIVRRLCGASQRAGGPAAVLGQVLDADHETPVAGARLLLEWIEYRIVRKRLTTAFEQRSAVSASDGHFRFCGLPGELTGSLSAAFGGDTTAKVGVRVDPILATRRLYLAPSDEASKTQAAGVAAPAAASQGTAIGRRPANLSGRIVNAKGEAIAGARVAIDRLNVVALSGLDGRFALRGIRPGTRTLNVRRLGFEPTEIPLDVSSDSPKDITVRLADFVPTLDTVVVTAMRRDAELDRIGFSRRKKAGMGTFIGPEKIKDLRAVKFVDLFNSVPMLRRDYDKYGRAKLVGRPHAWGRGCINYFVDGMPWLDNGSRDGGGIADSIKASDAGGIEDFIMPSEVGAIEVYAGAFAPAPFVRGLTNCDMTVVLWTRPRLGIR